MPRHDRSPPDPPRALRTGLRRRGVRVVTTSWADPGQLDVLMAPRDDVMLAERVVGDGSFEQEAGPFRGYRREVEVGSVLDGRTQVRVITTGAVSVPCWGPLGGWIARWVFRSGDGRDAPPEGGHWWAPPCRLSVADAELMGRAAALAVVAGFLGGIVLQVLTYVGADLGAGVAAQSNTLALLRTGALLTAAGLWSADRHGRRRVLLWALVAAALVNLLTAVSPTLGWVAGSQLVARGLVAIAALLIPVLVAEELPAGARAWAISVLFMAGGLGVGMVLWVLPFVGRGGRWRIAFALSALALPVIWRIGRRLPEGARFVDHRAVVEASGREDHRMSTRRLAALATILMCVNVFAAPVTQLQNEYLRQERGFSPTLLPAFLLLTNTWAGVSVLLAGRLADRRSRHLVAPIGVAGLVVGNVWMYAVGGWQMWAASFVGSFVGAAAVPALGVLTPELFPTGRRGGAAGILNVIAISGSVVGLVVAGPAIERWGYGPTFAALGVVPLVALPLLRLLPEGARIDLEVLNPASPPSPPPPG